MMSINDKPSLFFNSFFIALSECAFWTYFAKNEYNISFSWVNWKSVIPFLNLSGSIFSLFVSSLYEHWHFKWMISKNRRIYWRSCWCLTHQSIAIECHFLNCTSCVCILNRWLEHKFFPIHPHTVCPTLRSSYSNISLPYSFQQKRRRSSCSPGYIFSIHPSKTCNKET